MQATQTNIRGPLTSGGPAHLVYQILTYPEQLQPNRALVLVARTRYVTFFLRVASSSHKLCAKRDKSSHMGDLMPVGGSGLWLPGLVWVVLTVLGSVCLADDLEQGLGIWRQEVKNGECGYFLSLQW